MRSTLARLVHPFVLAFPVVLVHPFVLALPVVLVLLPACSLTDPGDSPDAQKDTVTWYRDVLPIVQQQCIDCHRAGGIAPFPLESWEEAAPMAAAMAHSVALGTMPPWLPAKDCREVKGDRVLTDAEIGVFQAWREAGAPEGEAADAPASAPVKTQLAWIDASLDAGEDYTPRGDASDEYRCLPLADVPDEDTYLIGFDMRPGVPSEVHHAMVMIGDAGEVELLDAEDEGAGWGCTDAIGLSRITLVGGWGAGQQPVSFPADTGILLSEGNTLVMQVHYTTNGATPVPDRTVVDLQFAHAKVSRPAYLLPISNEDFVIPANTVGYASTVTTRLPTDATLWGATPHMHGRGVSFDSSLKSGDEEGCLMDVPKWNPDWAQVYFFEQSGGVALHRNDSISVTCTWDNSSDHDVAWGQLASDEMCMLYLYVTDTVLP